MTPTQCGSGGNLNVSTDGYNHLVATSYSYDNAGNMTSDAAYTYAYDAENRITSANGVNYTYDGNGLRVEKSSGTLYWRSIWGDALAESDLQGNITNEYVFFAGRRIARISSSTVNYFYSDVLGTTHTITDATGHPCYDASFTPYGQEVLNPNISQTCSSNYKFTGYEYDSETGLYYAFARYYNLRLGRFMSADPLSGNVADPQSLNRYASVVNDPENLTDPLGLAPGGCKVAGRFGGGLKPQANCGGGRGVGCSIDGGAPFGCSLGSGDPASEFEGSAQIGFQISWECFPETDCMLRAYSLTPIYGALPIGFFTPFDLGDGSGGAPGPQTPTHPYLNCVKNSGNEASVQAGLQYVSGGHLGNGALAGAFLGNPFSDAIQFFQNRSGGAASAAAAAAPTALRTVPNVAVSYTSTTVVATPSEFTVITSEIEGVLPLGTIATGAADFLEGLTNVVTLPVSVTATAFGAVTCAAGN
ncbi:MAG: RHS repeat domain-containing protein [Candidatus Acidiferrales bacterium]